MTVILAIYSPANDANELSDDAGERVAQTFVLFRARKQIPADSRDQTCRFGREISDVPLLSYEMGHLLCPARAKVFDFAALVFAGKAFARLLHQLAGKKECLKPNGTGQGNA